MYRLILTPLTGLPSDERSLRLALPLARACKAHLDAVYVPGGAGSVLSDAQLGDLRMARQALEAARDATTAQQDRARETFHALCAEAGLAIRECWTGGSGASASWHVLEDTDELAARAKYADLVCLAAAPDSETGMGALREAVLFEASAPLLHLAAAREAPREPLMGGSVLLGWNGSTQAMGAIRAGLPLLRSSRDVRVVSPTRRVCDELPCETDLAEEMVAWLGLRGCRATTVGIEDSPESAPDLGEMAAAIGADLLIMGAYTHSRLRQRILGGVTRTVLEQAPIPVLLKH